MSFQDPFQIFDLRVTLPTREEGESRRQDPEKAVAVELKAPG